MRISDWSSDVCSSDLNARLSRPPRRSAQPQPRQPDARSGRSRHARRNRAALVLRSRWLLRDPPGSPAGARAGRVRRDLHRAQGLPVDDTGRSEEHTSELQSLMRIAYAAFCLKKKKKKQYTTTTTT